MDKGGKQSGAVLMDGNDVFIADDRGSLVTPKAVTISAYYITSSLEVQNLVCKRNQYYATSPDEFGGLAPSINASTNNEPHFAVISPISASCATPRPFTTMRQCPGGKLVIGGYVDDLPTFFQGAIDDLRIYNRPLNSFEIAELAKGY